MAAFSDPLNPHPNSRPSTSNTQNNHLNGQLNGHKRRLTQTDNIGDISILPLSDENDWHYPSHGYDSEEDEAHVGRKDGNWGVKGVKGARWVRKGKMAAWGPGFEEWEVEERARKRVKLLLPRGPRSPSPPSLPHLSRSPTPPLVSPYLPPAFLHLNYSSFVMDKSVTHTFRSSLLDELEHATNGLIEGEATLRTALGRLWEVMSEDTDEAHGDFALVPKREEEDDAEDQDDRARRLARAPDLTPLTHKLFLTAYSNNGPPVHDPSLFTATPERQLEILEKSLAVLRELRDDGREYVERLQEIRETIGDARAQRNTIWDVVRERAIKELQEAARMAAGVPSVNLD